MSPRRLEDAQAGAAIATAVRDLCHAAIGAAYGSIAALDKQWKRRVEALPKPNGLAHIYPPNELDQLVTDLETAAKEAEVGRAAKP